MAGEMSDGRPQRRVRMRRLDWCLGHLEEAQERGQDLVGAALAQRLSAVEPRISAEMAVKHAIRMVLALQRELLHSAPGPFPAETSSPALCPTPLLDEVGARVLTDRIRSAVGDVCMLLLEAHQRRAWAVLGYRTWREYVRCEFNISRTRSYELLDHARVVRAVEDASGVSAIADINVLTARQLKPRLPQILEAIRARLRRDGGRDRRALVLEVIQEEKSRNREAVACRATAMVGCDAASRLDDSVGEIAFDPGELRRAIEYLATLPDPEELAGHLRTVPVEDLDALTCAVAWLSNFKAACLVRSRHAMGRTAAS